MHPDKMKQIPEYLAFLAEVQPDHVVVGDTGVIYLLQEYDLPYIYDAQTLVTNARQINFGRKRVRSVRFWLGKCRLKKCSI